MKKERLSKILGNNTSVSVGNQNLITKEYDLKSGNILESAYGNGHIVSQDYDNLDRVIAKKYDGTTKFTYQYDASGNLALNYIYDSKGNIKTIGDGTKTAEYFYNELNELTR